MSGPARASSSTSAADHTNPGLFGPQSKLEMLPDSINLTGLSVRMLVGVDNWERVRPQPVTIDVCVHTDVSKAGSSDHLPYSIHYGVLTKEIESHCLEERYRSLEGLAEGLAKVCIFLCKAPRVTLRVFKPRALLHAHAAGVEITRTAEDFVTTDGKSALEHIPPRSKVSSSALKSLHLSPLSAWALHDRVLIKDLCISTILGVNPWERVDKQIVRINVEVFSGLERLRQESSLGCNTTLPVDLVTRPQNYRTIARSISQHVESTNFKTVESLATSIAMVAIVENRVEKIRVRVDKPSAIMFADFAGVEVVRDRAFFDKEALSSQERSPDQAHAVERPASPASVSNKQEEWHVAAIALGSNVGDRFANIEEAVKLLAQTRDCTLVDTSFLYETEPKYFVDQPRFINGACRISTRLSPHELLSVCQDIERAIGRDKTGVPVKGPRAIDLDILFYDRIELNTPDLILPHPGIEEREFVLKPLIDILPDYRHPSSSRTVSQSYSILVNSEGHVAEDMRRVLPSPGWKWGTKTYVMGILNTTPDSFSDGGDLADGSVAANAAHRMVQEGVDILDIGGMSTAPNAGEVSEEEELSRVLPAIQAIRQRNITTPISVDTFRAGVAEAALRAGANIINDVSAGTRDSRMFSVAHQFGCPIILMHMRGDSQTMNSLSTYAGNDVIGGVRRELEARVEAALRAGIRRWNIILDPGIGFAKDKTGNLELLRNMSRLQNPASSLEAGALQRSSSPPPFLDNNKAPSSDSLAPNSQLRSFPLLLGASRKRFLGTITGRADAKERMAGTAAACTAGIMGGVDVIRVHDVKEMVDVAKTADAIVRGT